MFNFSKRFLKFIQHFLSAFIILTVTIGIIHGSQKVDCLGSDSAIYLGYEFGQVILSYFSQPQFFFLLFIRDGGNACLIKLL